MVVTFPNSPYELHQPFPPAGDQPEAIDKLIEGIEDGLAFQTLLGVTGSGKTYTMANVIARTGRPALVLAPNKTLAAQLYSEFREFLPSHAVEYFVSYYDYYQPEAYVPSRDLYIEKDSSINEHIEQMRLSATKAILERPDCVIVATVSAIYGIGDPSEYHSMILHLRQGDRLAQREAIKRLTEMQYQRNDTEFRRGTFRVHGDVIDIFPAEHAENAIRVSLFDDEVESLQLRERRSKLLRRDEALEQRQAEAAADDRSDGGDVTNVGREPVEPRLQRLLDRRRNGRAVPALDRVARRLFEKERIAARALGELRCDVLR